METFTMNLPLTLLKEDEQKVPLVVVPPVVVPDTVIPPVAEAAIPATETKEINLLGDLFKPADESDAPIDEFELAATELELELPEGVTKWDAKTIAFQAKVKIEQSRATLNLDEYDPEVKTMFKYIQENGGSMIGLATDPVIKELNELTMYDSEDFYRIFMTSKLRDAGLSEASIENQIDVLIEEIEEDKREDFLNKFKFDKVRSDINPLINDRIEVLNKEKESYRSRLQLVQQGNDEKINKSMERTASELNDLVGIPFATKNKEDIIAGIKSGNIQKEIGKDPGTYQLLGYLYKQMGPKITEVWKDLLLNQGKSSYYAGVKKTLELAYGNDKKVGEVGALGDKLNDWASLKTR